MCLNIPPFLNLFQFITPLDSANTVKGQKISKFQIDILNFNKIITNLEKKRGISPNAKNCRRNAYSRAGQKRAIDTDLRKGALKYDIITPQKGGIPPKKCNIIFVCSPLPKIDIILPEFGKQISTVSPFYLLFFCLFFTIKFNK